jgi:hypothetical protein
VLPRRNVEPLCVKSVTKVKPAIHHLERTLPSAFTVSSLHQPRATSAAPVQGIDADEPHVGADDSLVDYAYGEADLVTLGGPVPSSPWA